MQGIRPAKEHKRTVDPILNADIYIPTEPGLQKKISANVSIINEAVSSFKSVARFIPCPDAYPYPPDDLYQSYLDVYAANQNYYLENRASYNDEDFYRALRELEDWFVSISEPCFAAIDYEKWYKREEARQQGISHYCDKTIRDILKRKK